MPPRQKRYYLITEVKVTFHFYENTWKDFQHAEQVKKAAKEYREYKEREAKKNEKKRVKRDWFATMSAQQVILSSIIYLTLKFQVAYRLNLHDMTIKKRHHWVRCLSQRTSANESPVVVIHY